MTGDIAEIKQQSEEQFQAAVIEYATLCQWAIFHPFDSRRSEAGYPDLTLVRERVVFVELKTEKGKVSTPQKLWSMRLLLAGAEYYLWRPSDWSQIEQTLRRAA
jgi:hypothetical protein